MSNTSECLGQQKQDYSPSPRLKHLYANSSQEVNEQHKNTETSTGAQFDRVVYCLDRNTENTGRLSLHLSEIGHSNSRTSGIRCSWSDIENGGTNSGGRGGNEY